MISTPRASGVRRCAGAAHGVGLQEVVRPHARPHQAAEERLERRGVVVDAGEQHGLVHHREARVGEARRTPRRASRGELPRVIEVRHHPERVVRPERAHELARDAHRQRHGHARREADGLDARRRAHRRDEAHEAIGRHRERIAAAHDDVAHLGVRAQLRERRRERLERAPRRRRRRPCASACRSGSRRRSGRSRGAARGPGSAARGAARPRAPPRRAGRRGRRATSSASRASGTHCTADGAARIGRIGERQVVRRDAERQPLALGALARPRARAA